MHLSMVQTRVTRHCYKGSGTSSVSYSVSHSEDQTWPIECLHMAKAGIGHKWMGDVATKYIRIRESLRPWKAGQLQTETWALSSWCSITVCYSCAQVSKSDKSSQI